MSTLRLNDANELVTLPEGESKDFHDKIKEIWGMNIKIDMNYKIHFNYSPH